MNVKEEVERWRVEGDFMGFRRVLIVFFLNMSILFSAQASVETYKPPGLKLVENQYFHLLTMTVNGNKAQDQLTVWCDNGDHVATGGCNVDQEPRPILHSGVSTIGEADGLSGWHCQVGAPSSADNSSVLTAYVVCETPTSNVDP